MSFCVEEAGSQSPVNYEQIRPVTRYASSGAATSAGSMGEINPADILKTVRSFRSDCKDFMGSVEDLHLMQTSCLEAVVSFASQFKNRLATLDQLTEQIEGLLQTPSVEDESRAVEVPASFATTGAASQPADFGPVGDANMGETTLQSAAQARHHLATPVQKLLSRHSSTICSSFDAAVTHFTERRFGRTVHEFDEFQNSSSQGPLFIIRRVARHHLFEVTMGCIIFFHAIFLGVETEQSLNQAPADWLEAVDFVFLAIYSLEIVFRLLAFGKSCWTDPWFIFDFILVSTNATVSIANAVTIDGSDNLVYMLKEQSEGLLVFRSLRLLRFIRILRKIPAFREVWNLIHGLLTSGTVVLSTFAVLGLAIYMFAIAGVELITKDKLLSESPETSKIVQHSFGNLQRTAMSLVQFVTLDSVAAFYFPLILAKPSLSIYFVGILLLVSIALMNLVTAILVEGASNIAKMVNKEDADVFRTRVTDVLPTVASAFEQLDPDGDGVITLECIKKARVDIFPKEISDVIPGRTMEDIFDLLDVDGSGEITQDEFVGGLLNIYLLDMPMSDIQILRLSRVTFQEVRSTALQVRDIDAKLDRLLTARVGSEIRL